MDNIISIAKTHPQLLSSKFSITKLPIALGLVCLVLVLAFTAVQLLNPPSKSVSPLTQYLAEPTAVDLKLAENTPDDLSRLVGETVKIKVLINPNTKVINGLDLVVKFNKNDLQLTNVALPSSSSPLVNYNPVTIPSIANASDVSSLVAKASEGYLYMTVMQNLSGNSTNIGFTGDTFGPILELSFKRLTGNNAQISFVRTPTYFTLNNATTPVPLPLPSPLPTGAYQLSTIVATQTSDGDALRNATNLALPFGCSGAVPVNASMCDQDKNGLTAATPITLVSQCTPAKCESICTGPQYTFSNGQCVNDPNYCPNLNANQCTTDGKVRICTDHYWTNPESCPAGTECKLGGTACTPIPNWCPTPNVKTCTTDGKEQTCDANNRLSTPAACVAGKECKAGSAGCTDIPNWCPTVGAGICSLGQLQTCGTNHLWGTPAGCLAGKQCLSGGTSCTDIPNYCPTNGAGRCTGNGQLQTCTANLWGTATACTAGNECKSGGTSCTPIANWCSTAGIKTCTADGKEQACDANNRLSTPVVCSAGKECKAGGAGCTDIPNWCNTGTPAKCTGDNRGYQTCTANRWSQVTACAASQICAGEGVCKPNFDLNNDTVIDMRDYSPFKELFQARDPRVNFVIDQAGENIINILDFNAFIKEYILNM